MDYHTEGKKLKERALRYLNTEYPYAYHSAYYHQYHDSLSLKVETTCKNESLLQELKKYLGFQKIHIVVI
jgi:hypothetical protein